MREVSCPFYTINYSEYGFPMYFVLTEYWIHPDHIFLAWEVVWKAY